MVQHGNRQLMQVVGALNSPRRFPCRLHGRKKQGHQDADDGDNHQQLNEREACSAEFENFRHDLFATML
jgi:hypothetical protein